MHAAESSVWNCKWTLTLLWTATVHKLVNIRQNKAQQTVSDCMGEKKQVVEPIGCRFGKNWKTADRSLNTEYWVKGS